MVLMVRRPKAVSNHAQHLHSRRASFETAASRPPQDEEMEGWAEQAKSIRKLHSLSG
jgi:hypothetical protein